MISLFFHSLPAASSLKKLRPLEQDTILFSAFCEFCYTSGFQGFCRLQSYFPIFLYDCSRYTAQEAKEKKTKSFLFFIHLELGYLSRISLLFWNVSLCWRISDSKQAKSFEPNQKSCVRQQNIVSVVAGRVVLSSKNDQSNSGFQQPWEATAVQVLPPLRK